MKLEQLPFDVREKRDNSKLPVFVMLRLTGIDDEDPSLLEGDMLPPKPLRFARDPEACDPSNTRRDFHFALEAFAKTSTKSFHLFACHSVRSDRERLIISTRTTTRICQLFAVCFLRLAMFLLLHLD